MQSYVSYKDIASQLDLRKGEIVNVSSDVLKLLCVCRENGESFDADVFIDTILDRVGPQGTVLFPTYSWAFCRGKVFDPRGTPSETGGLSNAALRRSDFRRTRHPIYSFAVWGKEQQTFCERDNVSAFGPDSPFAYLYEKNARNLFIGKDYKYCFAFVHYAEELVGVKYRYLKDFSSNYIEADGKRHSATYRMYVRNLDLDVMTKIHPRMDEVLGQRGDYSSTTINGVYFGIVNLRGAGDVMIRDLQEQGGLIYPGPVDS